LPGPELPAPAFVWLVEHETAPFGRFEAMKIVESLRAQRDSLEIVSSLRSSQ